MTNQKYAFKSLYWENKEINIDMKNLRYTDDIVSVSDNSKNAALLHEKLKQVTESIPSRMNKEKTWYWIGGSMQLYNEALEEVYEYRYLGHQIKMGRNNQVEELNRRIGL